MPNRRCGLQAGVEASSGVDRSMTEYTADNLVGAGIGIEKQLSANVAEKVGMNPQSSHEGGTVKRLFFSFSQFFVRSGKAVLRPVACDQVRGARGRGQGTETLAKLGGLPP